MPRLSLPEYANRMCDAQRGYSFPRVTFDFRCGGETERESVRSVEEYIGELLRSEAHAVRDGLSNVLYWGYARRPERRDAKVQAFRSQMESTDDRFVEFMDFVRSGPRTCAAEQLLALKRLQLPGFGQMSFATKILMFLDPDRNPVLDLKIARVHLRQPLHGLTFGTSIPITKKNADAYGRWAGWCRRIAERINGASGAPCGDLRAVDVERAVFELADRGQMHQAQALLEGPLDGVDTVTGRPVADRVIPRR